ncbi:MAG TPA: ATP-binding protein [Solirubrobacteraceae bacterium]|nr:ATP-binding protein [Solirubrobacteraceae bacterium]
MLRLRLARRSARLRLTLLYALLFLISGTVVELITYLLLSGSGPTVHVVARAVSPSGTIVISPQATEAAQHAADLARVLADSWIVLILTTLASIPLGWIVAGRVLKPLRTLTDSARTISAGNLHERLALEGPNDEFRRLGDTLDELLARLEASFDAQRRFVANASHELRTPLALERTLLQVALGDSDADAAELRATCEELLQVGAEQERLIEALLTLASSERGIERPESVELGQLVARELERQRAEIRQLGLTVQSELAPAHVIGDRALLERLVANLLENAAEYNVAHGRILIRTETRPEGALLAVENGGPLISQEAADRLVEPFERLDSARGAGGSGHHGLGLSIVRAIAVAHGATLTVRARQGGGLAVIVAFPIP